MLKFIFSKSSLINENLKRELERELGKELEKRIERGLELDFLDFLDLFEVLRF